MVRVVNAGVAIDYPDFSNSPVVSDIERFEREVVAISYVAKNAFTGASVGDTITCTQILDLSITPTTVSTIWRNQTTALDLGSAPAASDLTLLGSAALTDGQLRATPVPVSGSITATGNIPAGGADAGNPLKVGGLYLATLPTLADGNRGNLQLSSRGELIVKLSSGGGSVATTAAGADGVNNTYTALSTNAFGYVFNNTTADRMRGDVNGVVVQSALSTTFWSYAGVTGGITNTTDVAVKTAGGAGVRNMITGIQYKNTSATASEIVIKDGSTVLWRGHASANMTFMESVTFSPPLKGTANTAVNVAMITTSTATIVNIQGNTGT